MTIEKTARKKLTGSPELIYNKESESAGDYQNDRKGWLAFNSDKG